MRQVAGALDVPLTELLADGGGPSPELTQAIELLRSLGPERLGEARTLLREQFGRADDAGRDRRIALIGLRGAGKTTLGTALAEQLGVPFVELDREIERESGIALATIFDLYGQAGFRRMERRCLERLLDDRPSFVLATGGSIVSEPATFERLLGTCRTIWLKAAPAEHMSRVVAQGDLRPMAGNRESMADLERILAGREALYRRADAVVDTSGQTPAESLEALAAALRHPELVEGPS